MGVLPSYRSVMARLAPDTRQRVEDAIVSLVLIAVIGLPALGIYKEIQTGDPAWFFLCFFAVL